MAEGTGDPHGYELTSGAQASLEEVAKEYRFEVLVKARLIADGRNSDTVTERDVALAALDLSSESDAAYIKIPRKWAFRAILAVLSAAAAALVSYFAVSGSADLASVAGGVVALAASLVTLLSYRESSRPAASEILPSPSRETSEESRKWELLQAWLNIERQIRNDIGSREVGRSSETRPVSVLIDEYVSLLELDPRFRESLQSLLSARNRIAHGMPVDLSKESYNSLISQAEELLREIDRKRRESGIEN
ncbi:hypothetical protein [Streptomyces nigra]|uniref:DUF4145 domain-containing protein n=1 Tax=Streptomyces nigra TaxID=1827580 RepID=A0ABZ1IR19_9ACTN